MTFLPHRYKTKASKVYVDQGENEITALCLWYLAVYTVESSPNERGRIRALQLLHEASKALRATALPLLPESNSEEMLQCIEDEARELCSPLQQTLEEEEPEEVHVRGTSDIQR